MFHTEKSSNYWDALLFLTALISKAAFIFEFFDSSEKLSDDHVRD
jgi:hypothetical protein